MCKYGLLGVSFNGFNENLVLFFSGKCGMWVDVMVVVGMFYYGKDFKVVDKIVFVFFLQQVIDKGLYWLWIWLLVVLKFFKLQDVVKKFVVWVIFKEYINLVVKDFGWVLVLLGMCNFIYVLVDYKKVLFFFDFVFDVIQIVDVNKLILKLVFYIGVQFVIIFEFQLIGIVIGQVIVGVLVGKISVDVVLDVVQV